MARPDPGARLVDLDGMRSQLLSLPLADGISPREVAEYLKSLPPERFPSHAYKNRGKTPCIQPRGGVPLFEGQYDLTLQLDEAGADFIPLTIDSYTRHNQYDTAAELLLRSEEEGKNYLNGYPLVSHGYKITRELYTNIKKPVSLRHGTPDARLLVEIALASGITEIEGGGLCYCLPYSEGFPVDRSLLYWQYVDRVCALMSSQDRPIHRESFGPLSATMVPPAITISIQVIEALLAAEQGVRSFAVSFGQTGSFTQDLALAGVLRELTNSTLEQFGFTDMETYLVYHQWMGQFPRDREKAAALIVGSSIIAGIIQADKVVVKTVEEALGVPNAQVNAEAIKAVRYAMNTFDAADRLVSEAVHREATLIRSQALSILNAIYNMPGESFWESVFRAFQKGYIDLPFSPHADNANKLNCIRDANRSIRIVKPGNLPISDFDMQQELALLKTGDGSTRETAARLLSDINVMVQ